MTLWLYSRIKSAGTIPSHLHILWLGSPLKDNHRKSVMDWRRLNPSHRIFIGYDSVRVNIADFAEPTFISENKLEVYDVREFHTQETEALFKFIDNIYAQENKPKRIINYAAISDFLRYIVLNKKEGGGGWYADTDIRPRILPPYAPLHGFYIHMKKTHRDTSCSFNFSPEMFGAVSDSIYCKAAYQVILAIVCAPEISEVIDMVTSTENKCYTLATTKTTGLLGLFACSLLKYRGAPLFSLTMVPCIAQDPYDDIALPTEMEVYINRRERSWYQEADDKQMSNNELEHAIGPEKMNHIISLRNKLFGYCENLISYELADMQTYNEKPRSKM